ncbi:MAG: hypothetical protein IKS17_07000 [Firmicutes bacterium]|nr:hypothetical protein [Bacillota bacterium]
MKANLFVEFSDKQVDTAALFETAKEIWKNDGNKVKDLQTVELYYKPEESKCYYVFNGEGSSDSYFGV